MSTTIPSYFHTAALKQRFTDDLDRALLKGRLRARECLWLNNVILPSTVDDPDPVRVDRLTLGDDSNTPLELGSALMLSHGLTNNPEVYLHTLGVGVEVFADRAALITALRERFAADEPDALFEHEKIDGDPFQAQMLAIVDRQVELINHLTTQLVCTPSLADVAKASIKRQLLNTFPQMDFDPDTHLVQWVSQTRGDPPLVVATSTLSQAIYADACRQPAATGLRRRFLDASGRWASPVDSASFSQALTQAVDAIPGHYAEQLTAFWQGPWKGQRTVRDLAVASYANALRQGLYGERHAGILDARLLDALLPQMLPMRDQSGPSACYRLRLKVGDSDWVALAASFVIQGGVLGDESLLWCSPDHQWMRFTALSALVAYLDSDVGRRLIRPGLAITEQPVLLREGRLQVELEAMTGALVENRVDSIIELQARNLAYAMTLPRLPEQWPAMIDDALDIRRLLDPHQVLLDAGRWRRTAPFDFAEVWSGGEPVVASATTGVSVVEGAPVTPIIDAVDPRPDSPIQDSWLLRTRLFDRRVERLQMPGTVLHTHAEHRLQPYVSVLTRRAVRATDLRVHWPEPASPADSGVSTQLPPNVQDSPSPIDAVSLLLASVSGQRSSDVNAIAHVRVDLPTMSIDIPTALITHLLNTLKASFVESYFSHFEQSHRGTRRQGDLSLQPGLEALGLRNDAMRMALALCERHQRMSHACLQMAREALDVPVQALRTALNETPVEACSVSLAFGDHSAITLCDTLMLRQPSSPAHPVVFWSCITGWQAFPSVALLVGFLQDAFHGSERGLWVEHLGERDALLLQTHLRTADERSVRIGFDRMEGHVVMALQTQALDRQRQCLQAMCLRAVRDHFDASLFVGLAQASERDELLDRLLDEVSMRVSTSLFTAMLPAWVSTASVAELELFGAIMKRYYLACESGKDFMFAIPALQDFAHRQLTARLLRDAPALEVDPDEVIVTARGYLTAYPPLGQIPSGVPAATVEHSETLTRYAINRFIDYPDGTLSVKAPQHPQALAVLTPAYIQALVSDLDVGTGYIDLLRHELNPAAPRYALRSRLFVEQLPPALLAIALPEKLQGTLSAKAYAFIASVVDMPDGVAREPVDGTRVIISPLQLVADAGMSPDPVTGVFLIGPAEGPGPLVLYVAYHEAFMFREYSSRVALMEDIGNDASLQQLILERLDPEIRRRYDHGGFTEPHLPFSVEGAYDVPVRAPGPVTLGVAEIRGNALQFLFNNAVKLMLDTGLSSAVTSAEADHASNVFLATLGFEQALGFLPGKLGALVGLWQGHNLLSASAASVSGHRWGEALSEFSAAMGMMIAARGQRPGEDAADDQPGSPPAAPREEAIQATSGFSWSDTALSVEQRVRLQSMQATGVALSDMRHDHLLNVYRDRTDDTPYAVVAGKVYQVRPDAEEGGWRIVDADGRSGPQIMLDDNQRWQLDLGLRLRGGGGVVGTLKRLRADRTAEDVLIVEARGMTEIRRLYRDRARRIAEAHLQARRYLESCLDNLNVHQPGAGLDPAVARMLADFFGVHSPDAVLLNEVEHVVKRLLDAVMDVSLSPFSSQRFVVGTMRAGYEPVTAFVIKDDPQQRVFLTEDFFKVPKFPLTSEATDQGFDISAHYRAANLIHELSHLALNTHDIAYLNAMAPYPDLISDDTPAASRIRASARSLHTRRLSHLSDRDKLFKVFDSGQRRDIQVGEDYGYDAILRITETTSLDQARNVFLNDAHKRSRVMLGNADSVTLLVVNLGRQNRWVAHP